MSSRYRSLCAVSIFSIAMAFDVQAFGQEKKDDPVQKCISILEDAIKETKDTTERVRLTRSLQALKATAKPIKLIDFGKGETLTEGVLTYSFVKSIHYTDASQALAITIKVTNTSQDEAIAGLAWSQRILKPKIRDNTGRLFDSVDRSGGRPGILKPGASVEYGYGFSAPLQKLTEIYIELPHQHDKPDTVLLISRAQIEIIGK